MLKECWGNDHGSISETQLISYRMLKILTNVVEQSGMTQTDAQKDAGLQRYKAALKDAASRKSTRSPYGAC